MPNNYCPVRVKNSQTGIINTGYLIGTHLIITRGFNGKWEIWNKDGLTLFRNFDNQTDTLNFTLWLDKTYNPYFILWDNYTEADVFRLAMWTMPNGRKNYEVIEKLRRTTNVNQAVIDHLFKYATGRDYYQWYINIEAHDSKLQYTKDG